MKMKIALLLASILTAQSAFTQQNNGNSVGNITPIVAPGAGDAFIDSGAYDITKVTQDNTAIFNQLIANDRDMKKEDLEYLKGVADRLNTHLVSLIELARAFTELQQRASLGLVPFGSQPLNLAGDQCGNEAGQLIYSNLVDQTRKNGERTYLDLVNEINEKNDILTSEILTSTVISRASLPSTETIGIGNVDVDVSSYGNIDFSPLTQRIEDLRSELFAGMNSLTFTNLVTPAGQTIRIAGDALNPSLDGLQILTECQIQYVQDQIVRKSVTSRTTDGYQQAFVDKLVTLLNGFADEAGKKEWLRFRNENDRLFIQEAFQPILDAFWLRSYLRKKYGIPMGAVLTTGYPSTILNLEEFGLQPLRMALKSYKRGGRAESDNELLAAFNNARQFVELYDEKVTPVFSDADEIRRSRGRDESGDVTSAIYDYSAVETGFLVRANSAITWVTGQRHIAEILLMTMRLVLADTREELMLIRGDWQAQINYHDARYRATDALKQENNARICQVDFTLSESVFQRNCAPLGVKKRAERPRQTRADNIFGIFSNLVDQYENVEFAREREVNNLRDLLEAALRSGGAGMVTDEDQDGLFD